MLGFCEKCHDMIEYEVREVKKEKNIKGKRIEYVGKEAYCRECGEEMFVAEIRDYNLQMLDEAFRKQENLITVKEIEKILEVYDIRKRPLSLLLGWGECTVTRYLNGDIPTKQYSDILKKILEDPKCMKEILEQNKERITDHAYSLCEIAIEKFEEGLKRQPAPKTEDKIDSVVKYFLINCYDITPLALQKLLYYAQAFHKVFNGQYLFADDCEAWVHGPVYRNVYFKYKDYGYNPIEENIDDYKDVELTEVEEETLDSIIRNFGCYSGKVLEKMTHIETPWRQSRKGLHENEASEREIDKNVIFEYFNKIKNKYNMLNISDISDYSMDLFKKI